MVSQQLKLKMTYDKFKSREEWCFQKLFFVAFCIES